MRASVRRALASTALAAGLLVSGAAGAQAIDVPNPIGGIGDAILDKVCPPRQPPYPASPGAQIVERGGGPGTYAQYGYAGLRWTTYDAGCLSMDKADTGIGSQVNAMANSVDEVTNEMQAVALDPDTTSTLDDVIAKAVGGLRDAFWSPWSVVGFAMAGLLLVAYVASGRASDALGVGVTALVVLAVISTVLARPTMPAEIGNGLTSGVASGIADSLVKATPGEGSLPAGATAREKFTEGFYQVSYRAWLEGWSCGDKDAEAVYGKRLLAAQAFSVDELRSVKGNPKAAQSLVEAKGKDWLKIGEEMSKTHPAAFGCWKGEGNSRMGASIKHAVVTISAGFWIMLGSIALLALKWVLRLAVLFLVTFGALMLFWRRLSDHVVEFVLLGLLGPPFVAAGVGTLLWGYYAILLDRSVSWWMSGVSAFALGLALFMAKGPLTRVFVGSHVVERSAHRMRSGSRRVVQTVTHRNTSGSAGAAVAGAAAGGAAGAAVGAAVAAPERSGGPMTHVPTHDDERRQGDLDSISANSDAPAQALARARQMAQNAGHRPADPDARTNLYVAPVGTPVPTGESMDGWTPIGRGTPDAPPAPSPEQDAPRVAPVEVEPKRHGTDWRRQAMTERMAEDQRAWSKASGAIEQTFGQGDDRRDDA